jgi:predicted histidine transporter YuiF (NhaC family)
MKYKKWEDMTDKEKIELLKLKSEMPETPSPILWTTLIILFIFMIISTAFVTTIGFSVSYIFTENNLSIEQALNNPEYFNSMQNVANLMWIPKIVTLIFFALLLYYAYRKRKYYKEQDTFFKKIGKIREEDKDYIGVDK